MTEKFLENKIYPSIDSLSISLNLSQVLLQNGFKTLEDISSKEESFFTIRNIPGLMPNLKKELDTILKENNLTYKQ